MDDALAQEYLRELHVVRQVSRNTFEAYQRDLRILLLKLEESGLKVAELTTDQVRVWAARLHAQGSSPRSIARILSAWRGFYTWLANQKQILTIHTHLR